MKGICATDGLILSFLALVLLTSAACTHGPQPGFEQALRKNVVTEAQADVERSRLARMAVQEQETREPLPAPRFKSLSPLDTQKVTISFVDEDFRAVLQMLAASSGYNLMVDAEAMEVLQARNRLTAHFEERSVREILDYVCMALDLSWREQAGTIYVRAFEKRVFNLDFLNTLRESSFNVGGDVLGGNSSTGSGSSGTGGTAGAEVLTPLTGSYEITGGNSGPGTDIYSEVERSVAAYVGEAGKFYINRATGTLVVVARPRVVREVADYLETIKEKYRRQVLIEAKIVEVILNRNHEIGIDWKQVEINLSKSPINVLDQSLRLTSTVLNDGSSWYNLRLSDRYWDVSMVLHALEEFGSINTLSNPRLKVMNGQSAMISVGQSVSYLKSFEIQTTDTQNTTYQEPEVEIGALFDGVLLGVTPEIEADGHVNLHLVPIKSDIVSMEEREYGNGNRYAFPVVNLREASTVVRARSGEIIILGGLIHDRVKKGDSGLPVLKDLPLVGPVFQYQKDQRTRVELVIILSIKVVGHEQAV